MPIILTRKKSMVLGLGLLGSFFVMSGIVIYVHNSAKSPPSASSLNKEMIEGGVAPGVATPGAAAVGFVMNDFHRSSIKDGRTEWEIFGKRGRYNPLQNQAEVEEPRLTLTRPNGETVQVTAGKAVLSLTGSDINQAELFENVIVVHKGETTLKTSYAKYTKSSDLLEIPNRVTIDGPILSMQGDQLVGHLDNQEFIITKGVKTLFKPRKGKL